MQTVAEHLFREFYEFDFFQAVRLLEMMDPRRAPVGRDVDPAVEAVRFRSHLSTSFPPSHVQGLVDPFTNPPPNEPRAPHTVPIMSVAFLGLTGPQGAMPVHYTMLLQRLVRDGQGTGRTALRDWLDLFNHRAVSLFFRAWEKYRFDVPFLRYARYLKYSRHPETLPRIDVPFRRDVPATEKIPPFTVEEDPFTQCLTCFVGLGVPQLRHKLAVTVLPPKAASEDVFEDARRERLPLVRIEDLAVLHYGGLFAQHPRSALGLQAILNDYFRLPVRVRQLTGQWLKLGAASQSTLDDDGGLRLGVNSVIGEAVWDLMSKFTLRVGPLTYAQFVELLPDPTPVPKRKSFFLLSQFTKLFVGPDFDFDVQLVLKAEEVPECQLLEPEEGELGTRLGWNTWVLSLAVGADADDIYFEGQEGYDLTPREEVEAA
jgi:type VI secretion system protein ImpH